MHALVRHFTMILCTFFTTLFLLIPNTKAAQPPPVPTSQANVILLVDTYVNPDPTLTTAVETYIKLFRKHATLQRTQYSEVRLYSFNPAIWNGEPISTRTFRRQDYRPLANAFIFNSPKTIVPDFMRTIRSFPANRLDPTSNQRDPVFIFIIVTSAAIAVADRNLFETEIAKQPGKIVHIVDSTQLTTAATSVGTLVTQIAANADANKRDVTQCVERTHAECHMNANGQCGSISYSWHQSVQPYTCASANDDPTANTFAIGNCGNPNYCGCNQLCCFSWAEWSSVPCVGNSQEHGEPIPTTVNASSADCADEKAEFQKTKPPKRWADCSTLKPPAQDLARPTRTQMNNALALLKSGATNAGMYAAGADWVASFMALSFICLLVSTIIAGVLLCLFCKYGKKCKCERHNRKEELLVYEVYDETLSETMSTQEAKGSVVKEEKVVMVVVRTDPTEPESAAESNKVNITNIDTANTETEEPKPTRTTQKSLKNAKKAKSGTKVEDKENDEVKEEPKTQSNKSEEKEPPVDMSTDLYAKDHDKNDKDGPLDKKKKEKAVSEQQEVPEDNGTDQVLESKQSEKPKKSQASDEKSPKNDLPDLQRGPSKTKTKPKTKSEDKSKNSDKILNEGNENEEDLERKSKKPQEQNEAMYEPVKSQQQASTTKKAKSKSRVGEARGVEEELVIQKSQPQSDELLKSGGTKDLF